MTFEQAFFDELEKIAARSQSGSFEKTAINWSGLASGIRGVGSRVASGVRGAGSRTVDFAKKFGGNIWQGVKRQALTGTAIAGGTALAGGLALNAAANKFLPDRS